MIPVTFYNFPKKPNSTKQPDVNGTTANCELIEDTSIINPKIRWHEPTVPAVNVYDFNYCYIQIFGRYYFVTDIKYELGTWVVSLTVDVLATARDIIGPSTQYILRSAYEYDGNIVDNVYVTKTDPDEIMVRAEDSETYGSPKTLFGDIPLPCFIIGLIGSVKTSFVPVADDSTKLLYNGSVAYYVCRLPQLRQLMDKLLDEDTFVPTYDIPTSEISGALQKQLINPLQYIHSIKCMPCTPTNLISTNITGFSMGFNAYVLPYQGELGAWGIMANKNPGSIYCPIPSDSTQGYLQTFRCNIHLRLHPEYENRGHYVLGQPFSKYIIHVEPFGDIELAPGNILASKIEEYHDPGDPGADYSYIDVKFDTTVDYSTGDARLRIWSTPAGMQGEVVHYIGTQHVAIDVPFHQATQDAFSYRSAMRSYDRWQVETPLSILKGLFGVQMGLASGKATGQAMAGQQAAGTAQGMFNSMASGQNIVESAEQAAQVGITTGNSAQGSYMSFCRDLCSPVAHCYFYPIVDELRADIGRPLCKPKVISAVPGFNICMNGHIQSRLTATENQMIEDFMNGGFYYE